MKSISHITCMCKSPMCICSLHMWNFSALLFIDLLLSAYLLQALQDRGRALVSVPSKLSILWINHCAPRVILFHCCISYPGFVIGNLCPK